jgi:hypothetical protein
MKGHGELEIKVKAEKAVLLKLLSGNPPVSTTGPLP